jgi:hypothetical protein
MNPPGSYAYPLGRGVYPPGSYAYPLGRGVYPLGSHAYPLGRGVYPLGSHAYPGEKARGRLMPAPLGGHLGVMAAALLL